MRETFEDALNSLLDRYMPDTDRDEIISALELRLMALHEEEDAEDEI